ncbi:MAG: glutathione S-transferase family protein [Pikeienuella sp.]
MTKLVLYGVKVSAFVAKVRIVLDHKSLEYEELAPPDGYGSDAYRAIIPAGSVPGLTVDGAPLHDSNAIVEFLDDLVTEPSLRPKDALDIARMRALLGFHDTRLEAAARTLFPVIKGGDGAEAGLSAISAALQRLDEILAAMEARRPAGPFLFGAGPTLADLAYPCTLQMAEMMADNIGKPLVIPPRIADWRAASAEIPAVERSLAIAGEAMANWMAGFRKA